MLLVVTHQAQKLSFVIFAVLLRAQQGNNEENRSHGKAGLCGRCLLVIWHDSKYLRLTGSSQHLTFWWNSFKFLRIKSLLTRLVYRINDRSGSNISTGYFSENKEIGYHAGQSLVQITTSKSLLQTFFVTIVINFCIRWWHFVNSSKFVGASRPQSNKTSDSIKFESHTTLPFRSTCTT